MSLPLNQVITGDCTEIMRTWPSDSIDLVVTSPPYWGLRDYGSETVRVWGGDHECEHEWNPQVSSFNKQGGEGKQSTNLGTLRGEEQKSDFCSKCGAWRGSLGLEPHPQLFIDHLVKICREIKRVLKPSGTFWLNLGDTYYGSHAGKIPQAKNPNVKIPEPPSSIAKGNWLQPKQKLMMPARVAIALQHDGWILRNDLIWFKPNHMPSSVKDRLTSAYEHVFLFAKQRRYYFDLDAIRKPHQGIASGNKERKYLADPRQFGEEHYGRSIPWEPTVKGKNPGDVWEIEEENLTKNDIAIGRINRSYIDSLHTKAYNQMGKNPGDLWRIPTTPFPGAHFATFPPKLIEPIVKAGSPRWICSRCGKPRTRITEPTPEYAQKLGKSVHDHKDDLKRGMRYDKVYNAEYMTTGWSDCGCGAGWAPSVVLDPFGGSGTVGQVARRLGRRFILIEIIPEYCKMAEQRVRGRYKPTPTGVVPLDQFMEAEK